MAGSWLMDDDVPPSTQQQVKRGFASASLLELFQLRTGAHKASLQTLTVSRVLQAAGGCRRRRRRRRRRRWYRQQIKEATFLLLLLLLKLDLRLLLSQGSDWMHQGEWVMLSVFLLLSIFSAPWSDEAPAVKFFLFLQRNRLLLADQSLVDFVDVHFFLYFIFFFYAISVVATALHYWFGVLHKTIQLGGTPDVCVLSLRSGMVVTWV